MDPPEELLRAGRARRAVAVIAVALTVAAVAGVLYLRPPAARLVASPPSSPSAPTLSGPYTAAYDFLTPSLGWAVVLRESPTALSEFWIFRTDGAGAHWVRRWSGITSTGGSMAASISFFDRADGLVLFGAASALRTSDGGDHWSKVALPEEQGAQLVFADPAHGWFLANGVPARGFQSPRLYRTADGGSSWERLPDPPAGVLSFRNATEGWAAAQTSKAELAVYATWDGGRTWDSVPMPLTGAPPDNAVFEIPFVTVLPGRGVLAETGAFAFTTFDHGATWDALPPPPGGVAFADVAFQDATDWWAMPFGNLYRSSDAGRTWRHVTLRLDVWNYHLGVIDAMHAWARLDYATQGGGSTPGTGLALTSDGGLNWTYANVPKPV